MLTYVAIILMLISMRCPYCNSSTKVTNSRSTNHNQMVWRRRTCTQCLAAWTTHEIYVLTSTHTVKRLSQKHPEPFSRDELFMSIKESLQHRKTALDDATALTDTIITQVLALKTALIESSQIFELAHACLENFDTTAAAVYKAKNTS